MSAHGETALTLSDVELSGNECDAALSLSDSSEAAMERVIVRENVIGVYLDYSETSLAASESDFIDNDDAGVYVRGVGDYEPGEDAAFTCDGSGCAE